MSVKTGNACSSAPTLEQAGQETLPSKGFSPAQDCNTRFGPIASVLSEGPDNGLHLEQLADMFATDSRTVRLQIEHERRQGIPILSNNRSGYYLPACEHDVQTFVNSMRGRAREILETAKAVESGGRVGGD